MTPAAGGLRALFLAPAWLTMAGLFLLPIAVVLAYSFLTRGAYGGQDLPWTVESYIRMWDPLYLGILARSFLLAGAVTVLCVPLAFPLALFIARSGRHKLLWLNLVMLPFFTSLLVRTYAWMFLLRDTGLVNTLLLKLGVVAAPLPLLYNDGAVIVGLVYSYLPFMVLPIYATLERIDLALLEAAADLGERPWGVTRRVLLPLARPGILAGAVLVFIPSLGSYLTPDLLGGGKSILVGNVIQNQFTTARDWPFGAALAIGLMLLVLLLLRWWEARGGGELG
ncbi:MAG: ABC transporter permease [Bryobacterales bacterium]|nr:ABC transporter permease [Bryobacterales bacterium]